MGVRAMADVECMAVLSPVVRLGRRRMGVGNAADLGIMDVGHLRLDPVKSEAEQQECGEQTPDCQEVPGFMERMIPLSPAT